MINNKKELNKKMIKVLFSSCFFLIAIFTAKVFAGPFTDLGGKATTPNKYEATIKSIYFFNETTGEYVPFFTGASAAIDLGNSKVSSGQVGGIIGAGNPLVAGKYTKIRVIISRTFTMNGSAADVGGPVPGPGATCSTGGSGTVPQNGYTVAIVNRNGATSDQGIAVPPEANGIMVAAGLEIVNPPTNDIQVTVDFPSFTVLAKSAVLPSGVSVNFDVANTLEFLNVITGETDGVCYGLMLPPTITIIGPDGTSKTMPITLPPIT
jgi:hypothetical protein